MSNLLPPSSLGTVKLACRTMFVEGLGTLVRAWVGYVVIMTVFTILAAALIGWERLQASTFWTDPVAVAAFCLQTLIGSIAGVLGSTAWLRTVVEPGQSLRIQWKRTEWVFLGRLAQFAIILAIVLLVVSFVVTLVLAFGFGDILQSASAEQSLYGAVLLGLFGTAIVVGPTSLCASWYSLCLPAAASGAPSGLLNARDKIRGHAGRFFWAFVIAITVPTLAIALLESLLAGVAPQIVSHLAIWVLQFLAYVTCLTIAGLYFRELVASQSMADGPETEVRVDTESS